MSLVVSTLHFEHEQILTGITFFSNENKYKLINLQYEYETHKIN